MAGSITSPRKERSRSIVPMSSSPMRRLYPTMSAWTTAISFRRFSGLSVECDAPVIDMVDRPIITPVRQTVYHLGLPLAHRSLLGRLVRTLRGAQGVAKDGPMVPESGDELLI